MTSQKTSRGPEPTRLVTSEVPIRSAPSPTSGVPVDTGWAYVICAGCFVMTLTMSLYDQVLAVMFLDVLDEFHVSVTTGTVVFTVYSFTFSAGAIISTNLLVPRFGERPVIVLAALVNSLSTLVIAFSPNIYFYLSLHLFKGLSVGSMWIPALGLLGHYFKRLRSLASSLTNSGTGVALLAAPPLIRYLMDSLGFQGTLVLVSGLEMQAIVAGLLLRPASSYLPELGSVAHSQLAGGRTEERPSLHDRELGNKEQQSLLQGMELISTNRETLQHDVESTHESEKPGTNKVCVCAVTSDQRDHHSSSLLRSDSSFLLQPVSSSEPRVWPEVTPGPDRQDSKQEVTCSNEHVLFAKNKGNNQISQGLSGCANDTNLHQNTSSTREHQDLLLNNLDCLCEHPLSGRQQRPDIAASDLHDSAYTQVDSVLVRNSTTTVMHQKDTRSCPAVCHIFDLTLLSDWLVRILLTSTALGALLQYIPTYLPTMAAERGVSKPQAAILLTVVGGVSLISCLGQSLLVDCRVISAARYIAICQVIVGTMCHATRWLTSFQTLLLLSVTHGLFGGARLSLMPVVALDFVGVDKMGKVLGLNAMVATVSLSVHHPFLGYLLEQSGNFSVPYHYVGAALYISAALFLLDNVARSLNARVRSGQQNEKVARQ